MSQLRERRSSKRIKKPLHVLCALWNKEGIWNSVVVQDISYTGMRFLSKREFNINELLEVRISTILRTLPISIIGKVLGCGKDPKQKDWIVRILITQINEEDEIIFKKVIQMFSKEEV